MCGLPACVAVTRRPTDRRARPDARWQAAAATSARYIVSIASTGYRHTNRFIILANFITHFRSRSLRAPSAATLAIYLRISLIECATDGGGTRPGHNWLMRYYGYPARLVSPSGRTHTGNTVGWRICRRRKRMAGFGRRRSIRALGVAWTTRRVCKPRTIGSYGSTGPCAGPSCVLCVIRAHYAAA